TPVVGKVHGKDRCFVFAGGKSRPPRGGLMALDPATGKVDFEFPWRSRSYESVNAASPVLIGDRVFISATYDTGGALLDLKEDGGYDVAWTSKVLGTHWNTSIHDGGYLYGFDGRNEPDASLVCQEVATGKEVWRETLEWQDEFLLYGQKKPRPMSVYRGSLLKVDGAYLCLGERGHLLWLDLTPEGCEVLARTWLFAAYETWTPPVVSRGLLYVSQNTRDFLTKENTRLVCYDLRAPER
ncbi:MAG: PQQ-binding-like beta-propeller repeat protein, partial [Acidobacteriota bacterium]